MEISLALDYFFLGVSLISTACVFSKSYLIECCHFVAMACLGDLFFVKKKDSLLHHMLVLSMLSYLTTHPTIENREDFVVVLLSTEISTIFLQIHNLFRAIPHNRTRWSLVKDINDGLFVITFVYYRIYNYGNVFIINPNMRRILFRQGDTLIEKVHILGCLYGFFALNLYWGRLILDKTIKTIYLHRKKLN